MRPVRTSKRRETPQFGNPVLVFRMLGAGRSSVGASPLRAAGQPYRITLVVRIGNGSAVRRLAPRVEVVESPVPWTAFHDPKGMEGAAFIELTKPR